MPEKAKQTTIRSKVPSPETVEVERLRARVASLESQVNAYRTAAGVLAGRLIYATRRFHERAGSGPEVAG